MRFRRVRLTADLTNDTDWVSNQAFAAGVSPFKLDGGTPALKLLCFYKFTDNNGVAVSHAAARGTVNIKPVRRERTILDKTEDASEEILSLTDGATLTGVKAYQVFVLDEVSPLEEIQFQIDTVAGGPAGGVKVAFYVKELR